MEPPDVNPVNFINYKNLQLPLNIEKSDEGTKLTTWINVNGNDLKVTIEHPEQLDDAAIETEMQTALVKAFALAKAFSVGTTTSKVSVDPENKSEITKDRRVTSYDSSTELFTEEKNSIEGSLPQVLNPTTQFERANQIRKINKASQLFETEAPEKRAVVGFDSRFEKAKSLATRIETLEMRKTSFLLGRYNDIYQKLDTHPNLNALRAELKKYSLDLKTEFDQKQAALFEQMEKELVSMTENYNEVVQLIKDCPRGVPGERGERIQAKLTELVQARDEMSAKIAECNLLIGKTNLTTNPLTRAKAKVMDFAAVVEKKMELIEKKAGDALREEKFAKLLKKAPSNEVMNEIVKDLHRTLVLDKQELQSTSEAEKSYKTHHHLKWGASHLNQVLTTPANWTELRSVLVKTDRAGKAHVAVTINTPLLIGEAGGVPAGLRADSKYEKRPTNLFKTTSYIAKVPESTLVSFRGGQFTTKEAAKATLEAILQEGSDLDSLHVNALLTPMFLEKLKKDKRLLREHKANVLAAARELGIPENRLVFSNFGVNEGAVGEIRLGPLRSKLGWHSSIADYDNEAVVRLNDQISTKLNSGDLSLLDRLGAIVQVGLEMEAIWANNDYAESNVGNNQFKMPALWKTMDMLLGNTSYTNCMSGKDRTGLVESSAQDNMDEIFMNMADQRKSNEAVFDESFRGNRIAPMYKKILTSPCFDSLELKEHLDKIRYMTAADVKVYIEQIVKQKFESAKTILGNRLFEQKENVSSGFFKTGVSGIPTTDPKRNQVRMTFPEMTGTSVYLPVRPSENRQREAQNRRLNLLSGGLQITQVNTGKPGYLVKGGQSLEQFSSGFDRSYVLDRLDKGADKDELKRLLGLNELSRKRAEQHLEQLIEIREKEDLSDVAKEKAWTAVLREIEKDKQKSLSPKAKVKA